MKFSLFRLVLVLALFLSFPIAQVRGESQSTILDWKRICFEPNFETVGDEEGRTSSESFRRMDECTDQMIQSSKNAAFHQGYDRCRKLFWPLKSSVWLNPPFDRYVAQYAVYLCMNEFY